MLRAAPGTLFEAYTGEFPTGLAGTLGVRLRDGQGADSIARTTAGVAEDIAGSGVYRVTLTAPDVSGDYWLVWDDDDGEFSAPEQVLVTRAPLAGAEPSGRDLCNLDDVRAYMQLGSDDPDDDEQLQTLISAESDDFHSFTGRGFRVTGDSPATRVFDVDAFVVEERELPIDDAAAIVSVTVKDAAGNVVVTDPDWVERPRNRQDPDPITDLSLPTGLGTPASLASGYTIEVEAEWGWPSVPDRVRKAVVIFVARSFVRNLGARSDSGEDILPDVKVDLARDTRWALNVRDGLRVPSIG